MITLANQFRQLTSTAIILGMICGILMIWPGIIALFLGVPLLLRACTSEQETAALWLTEVGKVPILFA
jgi:UPF0716 family protein affecting phage T7 exclusion